MIELPELAILLILDQLSYEDLQSLRATCKKLKTIVDQKTSRNLHLFVDYYPFERELLHTGELVRYANTLHVPDITILGSIKFKKQFIGLRKLTIYQYEASNQSVNLDDLNCFEGLVHLQLEEQVTIGNGKLSLRNLKIALLEIESYWAINFVLDCPQLQVLGLRYGTELELTEETANSVRYLYINDGLILEASRFSLFAKLKKNLSSICFVGYHGYVYLNSFALALMGRRVRLPSLKQIQWKGLWRFPQCGHWLLRNLADLKNRQETKHIEVRMNGKGIESNELIEMHNLLHKIFPETPSDPMNDPASYETGLESDLLRHFNENPILHCLLPSVYGLVLRLDEDVRLSKQLIGRLTNLESLTIRIAVDEQFFESILKSCRRIWHLDILACGHLNQEQLDLIPDYLQNLKCLWFGYQFEQRNFDLHFLTKFKHLFFLSFDCQIPIEAMSFLFEKCNHPNFEIQLYGLQRISICHRRNENGRFEIRCYNPYTSDPPKITEFDDFDEVIYHYYWNDLYNISWDGRRTPLDFVQCALI